MKIPTLWLIIKLILLSLYVPIGFSLVPAIAFFPIAVWGYFIGGCADLNGCFIYPLFEIYSDQKFFRLLMLMSGVGLIMVFSMAYQNLKPWIHELFRKVK